MHEIDIYLAGSGVCATTMSCYSACLLSFGVMRQAVAVRKRFNEAFARRTGCCRAEQLVEHSQGTDAQ